MQVNASLTPKQEQLITKLLEGHPISESAKECGVNESTVHRWFKDSAFQQSYNEARQRTLNHSITSLQLKFDKAVETLDRHTNATKTIPRDQIKAAEVIVEKVLQTAELTKRIAELEAQLAEQQQDSMYKVIFDLRKASKTERETLEALNDRINARENA